MSEYPFAHDIHKRSPYLAHMDLQAALDRLPQSYSIALRMRETDTDDAIAERLGIAPEAIAPLIRVAEAKLRRLLDSDEEAES